MNKVNRLSKKWFLIALVVLIVATLLSVSSVYSQDEEDPCALGNLYLDIGNLEKAEEQFYKMLDEKINIQCAEEGLKEIAKKREDLLNSYITAQDYEKAKELIYGILALRTVEPKVEDQYHAILTQLAFTPSPTVTPTPLDYEIARKYYDIGRLDLSYDQLQTAIAANPDNVEISTFNEVLWSWPVIWEGFSKSYVIPVLIVIVSFAILYLIIKFIVENQKIKFDVGEFYFGDKKDVEVALQVKTIIEREIFRNFESNPAQKKYAIEKPMTSLDVSLDTPGVPKDMFTLLNFINRIIPQKIVTLSGVLQPSVENNGCGITLKLINHRGRLVDECTLWQAVYDSKFKNTNKRNNNEYTLNDYYSLIKPAALWTFWHIIDNYRSDNKHNLKKMIEVFGTTNIDSSIWNYLAMDSSSDEDRIRYLQNSLDFDRLNLQALFNLANIKINEATKKIEKILTSKNLSINKQENDKRFLGIYNDAIRMFVEIIEICKKMLKNKSKEHFVHNFSWYYLGAINKYLYIFSEFNNKCQFAQPDLVKKIIDNQSIRKITFSVIDLSKYFFQNACGITKWEGDKENHNDKKREEEMISFGKPQCQSLTFNRIINVAYQSIIELRKYDPKKDPNISPLIGFENVPFIGKESYNLACYYASMAGKLWVNKGDMKLVDKYMNTALAYTRKSPTELAEGKEWSSFDPSLYYLRKWIKKNNKIKIKTSKQEYHDRPKIVRGIRRR